MQFKLKPLPIVIAIFLVLILTGILASQFIHQDPLNSEERAWLNLHPVIRLAPDPNFPPLEYFDSQGQYTGLIADYFKLIEQHLNIRIEFVHLDSWDAVLAAAKAGKIDGITAAQVTPDRSVYLTYTSPLLDIPNAIIVQKDVQGNLSFDKMAGMSVAVTRGYATGEYISANFPKIKLVQVNNDLEALTDVSFKQVDAAVVNEAIASYLIDQQGITNLRIAGDSGKSNSLAIATRKNIPILRDILEKGLKSIDPQEQKTIYLNWVHLGSESGIQLGRDFWLSTGLVGSIIIILLLITLLWNVTLQNQVRQRTEELKNELEERRQAENALHESQQLLSDFMDISPVAISWARSNHRIEYINREWERLFGYSLDEVTTIEEWFSKAYPNPDYRHQVACMWADRVEQAQKSGQHGDPLEVEITCKDGSTRQVSISFTLIADLTMVTFSDMSMTKLLINEIRQLNADLEKRVGDRTIQLMAANHELEAFTYSVSHDLRAPLRSINGFSNQLLEENGAQLDDQGHEYLNHILNTTRRMSQIINDLLKLSHITRSEMVIEQVDLSELVRGLMTDIHNTQAEREMEVVLPEHIIVMGDTNLLCIALDNLLRNAWKFTSKCQNTRIEFGVLEQENKPVYFVKDNGAGFDMAYVDKLFNAFSRLHSVTEYEGTGIGLAIVKRIIERHGGDIWAEGKIGQGAVFYFTLL